MFPTGLGRSYVHIRTKHRWEKIKIQVELPANTLLYGEIVTEMIGEARGQRRQMALHIIDAYMLGGKIITNLHVEER